MGTTKGFPSVGGTIEEEPRCSYREQPDSRSWVIVPRKKELWAQSGVLSQPARRESPGLRPKNSLARDVGEDPHQTHPAEAGWLEVRPQ